MRPVHRSVVERLGDDDRLVLCIDVAVDEVAQPVEVAAELLGEDELGPLERDVLILGSLPADDGERLDGLAIEHGLGRYLVGRRHFFPLLGWWLFGGVAAALTHAWA